jgi:ankyrin repeat protein
MWAIASGNRSAVKAVLDSGTDPNGLPESQEDENVTPLAAAAADGKLEIVRLLLNRGADVNLSDCWEPPLAVAACEDRVEVVKLLIARGATVNDSERGSYALWRAAVEGKAASVRVLLAHGANPNSYNVDGSKKETLLQVVEGFHLPEVVAILRQAGAK